jgi:type I restriction enzyme R subunit
VGAPMLEVVRKQLRSLVKLIDRQKREPIYTDFEDQMGGEVAIDVHGFPAPIGFERFRARAWAFLRACECRDKSRPANADHIGINKLRLNKALTQSDLGELGRMLVERGVGAPEDLEKAKEENHGLCLFIRSVGLDREAAKEAVATFLSGKPLHANQIEFVNLIVHQLTGTMKAERHPVSLPRPCSKWTGRTFHVRRG